MSEIMPLVCEFYSLPLFSFGLLCFASVGILYSLALRRRHRRFSLLPVLDLEFHRTSMLYLWAKLNLSRSVILI